MGLQRAPIQRFGGLNTVDPPYDLEAGESPDLMNVRPVRIEDTEAIQNRKGMKNINSGGATPASVLTDGTITRQYTVLTDAAGGLWIASSPQTGPVLGGLTSILAGLNAQDRWCPVEIPSSGLVYLMPYRVGTYGGTANPTATQSTSNGGAVAAWAGLGTYFPRGASSMVYWRGRLVAAGISGAVTNMNRVAYTDVGDPNAWNNFVDIYDDDGSRNVDLVVHNNNLYLFKQSSVWLIYDNNTFASRLIARVGVNETHNALSCNYDKRLYWFSMSTKELYSSNGETDLVVENRKAPTPMNVSVPFAEHSRLDYDPEGKSILLAYSGGASATDYDRLDEFPLFGKPGEHPTYRHSVSLRTMFSDRQGAGSNADTGQVLATKATGTKSKVFHLFGQANTTGLGDDGTTFTAYWNSAWLPIISEEPWERIRRVNILYRASNGMIAEIYSAMKPEEASASNLTQGLGAYAGSNSTDRTFKQFRGPNARGRYHKVKLSGGDWSVSAVEFAIRGGKSKRSATA